MQDLLLWHMDSLVVAHGFWSARAQWPQQTGFPVVSCGLLRTRVSVVEVLRLSYSVAGGILVPQIGIKPVSPTFARRS